MQRRDSNGVAFDGSIDHCDVCAVGKSRQLAHPKKAKYADITAPFQLVYGDLMGHFKSAARGGYDNGRSLSGMGLTRERWCYAGCLWSRLDMYTCQTNTKDRYIIVVLLKPTSWVYQTTRDYHSWFPSN